MDEQEINKHLAILDRDDCLTFEEKYGTARSFIDMLLGALQDAEAALETYRLMHSSPAYHYYVVYSHEEGYGCMQVEMNKAISGGMDILDLVRMVEKESGVNPIILLDWKELDHL